MNDIIENYLEMLLKSYSPYEKEKLHSILPAAEEKIIQLKKFYPDVPIDLIEILKKIDGTSNIRFIRLEEHDEYCDLSLCKIDKMLQHAQSEGTWIELYGDIDEDDEELFEADINPHAFIKDWLLFADNSYSGLYIDFNPSHLGKKGQIIQYIHDPDTYFVIADSLNTLLKNCMDSEL